MFFDKIQHLLQASHMVFALNHTKCAQLNKIVLPPHTAFSRLLNLIYLKLLKKAFPLFAKFLTQGKLTKLHSDGTLQRK